MPIKQEIEYYNSLPVVFNDFVDIPNLADDEIELFCTAKNEAVPEKNFVPSYVFEIKKDGAFIGEINIRIGYTEGIYYAGHIGCTIESPYRGRGYAVRACRLLIPIVKMHAMKKILITNDKDNTASIRLCEKLGAKLLRTVSLPEWHDLRETGSCFVNVFEWTIA